MSFNVLKLFLKKKLFRVTAAGFLLLFVVASLSEAADRNANIPETGSRNPFLYQFSCDFIPSWDASLPLGNGEIGLNAWFNDKQELEFFISRTDSFDDYGRLVKVGGMKIQTIRDFDGVLVEPNLTLDVSKGTLTASFRTQPGENENKIDLRLWVDANRPVVVVEIESEKPSEPVASLQLWRTEPGEKISGGECSDLFWNDGEIVVKPDKVIDPAFLKEFCFDENCFKNRGLIGWFHHNEKTRFFDEIAKTQGLDEFAENRDPYVDRTFGAIVSCSDPVWKDSQTLASEKGTSHRFEIVVSTEQPSEPGVWTRSALKMLDDAQSVEIAARRDAHLKYWNDFWNRSWIHFSKRGTATTDASESNVSEPSVFKPKANSNDPIDDETFVLTRAYYLQRYVDACEGRGNFPIKFNGGIFTVPAEGKPGYADYRRWGPGYWFQNTRLPYYSKTMAGDFDLSVPFFENYAALVPICEYRTKKYLGHDGAYFPECIYLTGEVFPETYGRKPWNEREDKLQETGWHKWEWVGGLELVFLMLNYYEFTQDETFLNEKLLPTAQAILTFFDCHYQVNPETGKLKMHPSQALETWWDCDDPAPEVAGIRSVTQRLLALPEDKTTADNREFWATLLEKTPEVPTRIDEKTGTKMLAPAARFAQKCNVENPELYPVFPFRLFSFEKPNPEWALAAFEVRLDGGYTGWRQDDLFLSYLGDSERTRANLVGRAKSKNEASLFPVFWGPNYDWIPDQDHGSILTAATQSVVMQVDGKKIYLTPSLPKEWDVSFKLHAPYQTTIEGKAANGKIVELKVTPEERRQDIQIIE